MTYQFMLVTVFSQFKETLAAPVERILMEQPSQQPENSQPSPQPEPAQEPQQPPQPEPSHQSSPNSLILLLQLNNPNSPNPPSSQKLLNSQPPNQNLNLPRNLRSPNSHRNPNNQNRRKEAEGTAFSQPQ